MLYQIIFASFVGSVVALIGGVILLYKESWARRISLTLVSFAAGALIGAAFFDLLPEALEEAPEQQVMIAVVVGILTLFLIEKFLKWYHCHDHEECDTHAKTFSSTVLIGDGIHNFLDGIAIAAAFVVSVPAGIATTIAVFFHEVPQEIGDFGVLLHSGYKKSKVFFLNLITALTTPAGAILGYFLLPAIQPALGHILGFTAGAFIYIAASDLLPEVRHKEQGKELGHTLAIILGILLVFAIGVLIPE